MQKLEREYTRPVSESEIIQKIYALGADEEEDDSDIDYDSWPFASTSATLLPESDPYEVTDATPVALLYSMIKTATVQPPAPARATGCTPHPRLRLLRPLCHTMQKKLRHTSLQYGKKLTEDWLGLLAQSCCSHYS